MSFLIANILILLKILLDKKELMNELAYSLILFSSFYSISLIHIESITYNFKIPEYLSILLIIFFLFSGIKLKKKTLFFFFSLSFIFIIPLLIRSIHFVPVEVWEVEASKRVDLFTKTVLKNHISLTNFTQLLYIILGGMVFVIFSSLKLSKDKTIKYINNSLFIIIIISIIQLILFYSNHYDIFMNYFYSIDSHEKYSVTAYQTIYGYKRISAVMEEPSTLGYYLTLSLFVLTLINPKPNKILYIAIILLVILSTSVTGYLGLLLIFFLRLLIKKEFLKLILYVMSGFLLVVTIYFIFYDFIQLIIQYKSASTNERLLHGLTLPLQALSKMPFWGLGVGTDRPSIMFMNILTSIGLIGILLLGLTLKYSFYKNRNIKYFLLFYILIGLGVSNLQYLFFWIYLGLLNNKYIRTNYE